MKHSSIPDNISFDDMSFEEELLSDALALLLEHPDKFVIDEDGSVNCVESAFLIDDDLLSEAADEQEPYGY